MGFARQRRFPPQAGKAANIARSWAAGSRTVFRGLSLSKRCRSPLTALTIPVMVWLHGGGFTLGAGGYRLTAGRWRNAAWWWSPSNYRLGHLGFSPILRWRGRRSRGAYFCPAGSDRRLEWVRDNIAAFGGNPETSRCLVNQLAHAACCRCWPRRWRKGYFIKAICAKWLYTLPDAPREQGPAKGKR